MLHLLTRKVGACYLKTPFKLTKIVVTLIIKHKSWLTLEKLKHGKHFNSKYQNGVDFLKLSRFSQFLIGGSASQSLRISYIAIHETNLANGLHSCIRERWLWFVMTSVWLTSQLSWQHNGIMIFFSGRISRNRTRKFVPVEAASMFLKFDQIFCEHYRDILRCSFWRLEI